MQKNIQKQRVISKTENSMNLKIGDSVIVNEGVNDPDFNDFSIGGWQGRIIHISDDEANPLIEIEWDSLTLKQIPQEFIINAHDSWTDFTSMNLNVDEIEVTTPRDSEADAESIRNELHKKHPFISVDQQEKNIFEILSNPDSSVNEDNLETYLLHLKKTIEYPCLLTGSEDFAWEEPYLLGGWDKKEYEKLKKTQPSYTDIFELIGFDETLEEDGRGLFVTVKRISDRKKFTLPLWDLKATDKQSGNYLLISDYSFWMTNYQ